MPIFSATITTIIVFLPIVFLEGHIKFLFIPLTFTISVWLFASFLVSRTVTPLLALRVLLPESRSIRARAGSATGCSGSRSASSRAPRSCISG